ncbi:unnamed protein product [Vicia faba]|uniref:Uncharacterized protein n=1 Tax=Vicia faba TaxID=3906 RepID=A0AAV0YZ09_VICFA|nr:unnamed protein product [Vicia faba]
MSVSAVSTTSTQISTAYQISTANKRKFEFDSHSGCNSKRHTLARPNNMNINIVDVNEVFRQLRLARYGEGSFDKFRDWKDTNLWKDLLRVLIEQRHLPINLGSLFFVVSDYARSYAMDPHMEWLTDESLKRDVAAVFKLEPLADQKGCLSIEQLEVVMQNMKNTGLLVSDEQVGETSFNSDGRSGGKNPVKRLRGRSSTSSGERRLKCSENFEELGNILQLTLVYRDACHALFFISKQLNVLGMLLMIVVFIFI